MSIRQGNKIIAGNVDNTDYTALLNKPQINYVELSGNKSLDDLGIQAKGEYATIEDTNEIKENYNKLDNQKTNCLTKIPQDIKVELKDGFIYVKAGSKIYFPDGKEEDGTNKFKEVILSEDIKSSQGGTDSNVLVLIDPELTVAKTVSPLANFSGETDPNTQAYSFWYDTANNIIKHMPSESSEYISGYSLPVCVENQTDGSITAITQVFNGFGYIGSTIFALPGVEGIIPNGRNEDGSLNNNKFTTTNIITVQYTGTATVNIVLTSKYIATVAKNNYYYDEENNYHYRISPKLILQYTVVAEVSFNNGTVISFNPKYIYQSVDKNDTEWTSTQCKPSNRYIDLNLEASGTTYISPANGWICLDKATGTADTFMAIEIVKKGTSEKIYGTRHIAQNPAFNISDTLPVLKGEEFKVYYNMTGDTSIFRFIYDEGVK